MKLMATLLLFLSLIGQSFAKDAHYLISEMEKLRDSLSLDDPARIDLTLRLADLYFDVSIKEGGEGDHKTLKANRAKALDLYRHSLDGTDGVKKAEGLTRLKIEFQMGRLLSRMQEYEEAEPYYLRVQAHPKVPKKMKEQSSLALAEWYEEDAKYEKSKKFYDQAISLCDVRSSCNYAHYRKGWLYFKDTKLNLAIKEMKASLWATDTEIRESSLQDLILFMSNQDTDGIKELEYTKTLSAKINRPELVQKLVEAFYVAGNRRAGSNLLADINETSPSLYFEVRLLEEFYGFRNWERVDKLLLSLETRSSKDIPTKKEHAKEVNKILRRYLVQVDSEANVVPELNPYLKRSIDIYLSIYPNDDLRKKLQQGWIKAEEDEAIKLKRLGRWIKEDIDFGFKPEEIRKLRQTRLSLAQKLKNSDIVIEESLAIAEILKDKDEAFEFQYVAAREYYQRKEHEKALPLFNGLVNAAKEKGKVFNWALLSQNLILDIYNGQDAYKKILAQITLWNSFAAESTDKKIAKENEAMKKLSVDARFALAAKMKDSPESLEEFFNFCFSGIYPKKSCPNAKVLAVKMGDQEKIIKLLQKENNREALMNEYELMGRFSDAAKLQEQLKLKPAGKKAKHELYLKIALLYELDQNLKERDRMLHSLIRKIKREKTIPKKLEGAIFLTLDEAGLVDSKAFFLPWSLDRRLSLATRLQLQKPNKAATKLLMSQKKSQGPAWSRLILNKVQKPFSKIGKISFYGRYSKYRFKKRTKAINNFVSLAKPYLDGADLETRIYILHMLTRTYEMMTEDILATPLPPDLDPETMAQVQVQLQTMSAPFETVRADYQRLLDEQMGQLTAEMQPRIKANIDKKIKNYSELIIAEAPEVKTLVAINMTDIEELKTQLLKNPSDKKVITELKAFYENKEHKRLAAYYSGRLDSLEN